MTSSQTGAATVFPADGPGIAAWFTPIRFAAILGVLLAFTFPEVLTGQRTFFYRDFGVFTYPVAHYFRECFWRGELPLWNPLNNCGVPLLAQWNTAILYPPSLFYLLFPLSWSLGVFNVAHLFFAGLGMYFLARRWTGDSFAATVAGLAFGFNGLSWHMLMWVSNLAAWAWMPWVVLAVEDAWRRGGRRVSVAALAGAMQMLSGAPEIIVLTWCLLGALWLLDWARGGFPRGAMTVRVLAAGALVAGLSAVQLLPFLDLLGASTRDPAFSDTGWSMPLSGLANLLVPLFRAQASGGQGVQVQYDQYWTSSYYIGVVIVALAVLAAWRVRERGVRLLAGAAVFGVVMALGSNGFLYNAMRAVLPQLGLMRYPIKFIVLTLFVLPLLAAHAVNWFLTAPRDSTGVERSFGLVAAMLGGLVLLVLWRAWEHPQTWDDWSATWHNGLGRILFLAMIAGTFVLLRRAVEFPRQLLWALSALVLAWADVYTHAPEITPTVARAAYEPGVARGFRNLGPARFGEPRFMPTRAAIEKIRFTNLPTPEADYAYRRVALYDDCNLLEDIPKTDGFFSVELRESARLLGVLENYDANDVDSKGLKDFLGVGHINSAVTLANNALEWSLRPSALPLIMAGQKPVFADGTNAAAGIFSAGFDPRQTVYLPTAARQFITASNQVAAQVAPRNLSAERLDFEVAAPAATMVTVAQSFYPAWHAYVDGHRVQLWYANYAFQALEVPAGRHQVSLRYEDRAFYHGALISICSLLACGAWWLAAGRLTS